MRYASFNLGSHFASKREKVANGAFQSFSYGAKRVNVGRSAAGLVVIDSLLTLADLFSKFFPRKTSSFSDGLHIRESHRVAYLSGRAIIPYHFGSVNQFGSVLYIPVW